MGMPSGAIYDKVLEIEYDEEQNEIHLIKFVYGGKLYNTLYSYDDNGVIHWILKIPFQNKVQCLISKKKGDSNEN